MVVKSLQICLFGRLYSAVLSQPQQQQEQPFAIYLTFGSCLVFVFASAFFDGVIEKRMGKIDRVVLHSIQVPMRRERSRQHFSFIFPQHFKIGLFLSQSPLGSDYFDSELLKSVLD